ncbi:unnamed protein product [Camellia sinensis]
MDCDKVMVMDAGWAREYEAPSQLLERPSLLAQQYSDYYAFRGHEVYHSRRGRKEGLRSLIRSRLSIGSPLMHLDRGLHSIEVSQGIDGPVDMKPIYGTTVVRKLEEAGK